MPTLEWLLFVAASITLLWVYFGHRIKRWIPMAAIWDRWGPAVVIGLAVISGYWLLIERALDRIDENIATLRAETGQRLEGREIEGRRDCR